eukprot:TRINITY_DN10151_c0_g1_i1.p1 TRINITY_DN10151_c0_g1~~TRINITY_DN10151_c0_g1_i1.p1  ORF type:complete len:244 (-),score=54.71 TRINITY_DN10151_c0_g1_i1:9-740(-)
MAETYQLAYDVTPQDTHHNNNNKDTDGGSSPSKAHGKKDEIMGNAKQTVGQALDKPELEASGQAQQQKGVVEQHRVEQNEAVVQGVGYEYPGYEPTNTPTVRHEPHYDTPSTPELYNQHLPNTTTAPQQSNPTYHYTTIQGATGRTNDADDNSSDSTGHGVGHVLRGIKDEIVGGCKIVVGKAAHKEDLAQRGHEQKAEGAAQLHTSSPSDDSSEKAPSTGHPTIFGPYSGQKPHPVAEHSEV